MKINEALCAGIDMGIASNGWAILDVNAKSISGSGVRLFDAPETDKERKPKNQIRQEKRSLRRTVRRKARRMDQVRRLCLDHGLVKTRSKDLFHILLRELNALSPQAGHDVGGVTPWALRAEALSRRLSGAELAVILGHIAKHAGFQSNRKGGEKNAAGDDQKALKAMEELAGKIGQYRTFGEALQRDPGFGKRKRNREGVYDRTPKRDWLRAEISIIFEAQRKFGSELATSDLEEGYCKAAFTRNPLQDSEHLVRCCPFEEGEKRASRYAPSFERFRLLQSLAHLRIDDPDRDSDSLAPDEIARIEAVFGNTRKLTFNKIRAVLGLSDTARFRDLPGSEPERKEAEKRDVAARKKDGAEGTYTLRAVLGELYDALPAEQLDDAMARIAFRETNESIEQGLSEIGLPDDALSLLIVAVKDNAFYFAAGAAHVSAKACRKIIPGLRAGHVYYEACALAGYDHTAPERSPLAGLRSRLQGLSLTEKRKAVIELLSDKAKSPINSPVARKAAIEAVKQFVAICHKHPALAGCLPGQVNIELAREMGKGPEERSKLRSGIERRNRDLDKLAGQFEDTFKRRPEKGELRVYELAQEQGWRCLYTDDPIDPNSLFDGVSYQVDHILPWSRFGDNSFTNLTLCTAWANQNKKNRTPYEWMVEEGLDWESFAVRVEARPGARQPEGMKGFKKRNYLLKKAAEKEEAFRTRNLNDTRWAARVALQAIEALYPLELNNNGNPIRRVRARSGGLTSLLRRGWGLERLKKDKDGKRTQDDRHNALDAIVIAATDEAMVNRLTRAVQRAEQLGKSRHFERIDLPWPDFREQVQSSLSSVICSRAERRRARGEGHKATLRGLSPGTECVFVRQAPEDLVRGLVRKSDGDPAQLESLIAKRFQRPERSRPIIEAIADWALRGAPKDQPPLGPTGDPIRRVRVIDTGGRPAVLLGEKASADRGDMVRVDVFSKKDAKGRARFYLVPVYPHQIMNKRDYPAPPDLAIVANKPESAWERISEGHQFRFSLHQRCWVEVIKPSGEVVSGYYMGTDRSNGKILISPHYTLLEKKGVGTRTLLGFKKFSVDRLGNLFEVKAEPRMWRGEVCISATPPD